MSLDGKRSRVSSSDSDVSVQPNLKQYKMSSVEECSTDIQGNFNKLF